MLDRNHDEDMRIKEAITVAANAERSPGDSPALIGTYGTAPVNQDDSQQRPFVTGESKLRAYSRADVLEKEGFEHIAEAQKRQAAASFLRSHPEFERFMDLIRTGALSLY